MAALRLWAWLQGTDRGRCSPRRGWDPQGHPRSCTPNRAIQFRTRTPPHPPAGVAGFRPLRGEGRGGGLPARTGPPRAAAHRPAVCSPRGTSAAGSGQLGPAGASAQTKEKERRCSVGKGGVSQGHGVRSWDDSVHRPKRFAPKPELELLLPEHRLLRGHLAMPSADLSQLSL